MEFEGTDNAVPESPADDEPVHTCASCGYQVLEQFANKAATAELWYCPRCQKNRRRRVHAA